MRSAEALFERLSRRRYRSRWVFLGTIILSVVALMLAAATFGSPGDASADAIRDTVANAIRVEQTAPFPPPSGYSGGPMSSTLQQSIISTGEADFAKSFAEPELSQRASALRDAVDEQASGQELWLSGGVDNIQVSEVAVSGTTARVSASAEVWAVFAQVQADGKVVPAYPRNKMLYTFVLQEQDGAWLVTDQVMTFAPGSEP